MTCKKIVSLKGLQQFGNQDLFSKNRLLLQPSEIAPAGLELAVVAVADEFGQRSKGVVLTGSVVVVLDAVHLDSAVVFRAGLEEMPSLVIGPNGVQNPVLEDEAGGVQRRRYGQAGWGHFPQPHQTPAAGQIMLAPVASLPAGREVLHRLAVVNAFLRTVDPAEAQCHLHGVHVSDYAGAIGRCPVHAQPEVRHRGVMLKVPRVQLLARVYVKQVGDVHTSINRDNRRKLPNVRTLAAESLITKVGEKPGIIKCSYICVFVDLVQGVFGPGPILGAGPSPRIMPQKHL